MVTIKLRLSWALFKGLATIGVGAAVRDEIKRGTIVGKELKVKGSAPFLHVFFLFSSPSTSATAV